MADSLPPGRQLSQACSDFDLRVVKMMLSKKIDKETLDFQNNGGATPLMIAIGKPKENDAMALVSLLMPAGPSLDVVNKQELTALMLAAKKGFAVVCEELISHNADIDITTNVRITVSTPHLLFIKLLLVK